MHSVSRYLWPVSADLSSWGLTLSAFQAQLRLTAQRLGQLQSKQDSAGQITRRDIGTLLGQGNVPLARAKAQKLIRDEALADVFETLEMHVGTLLERFAELETRYERLFPGFVL
jgi:hypothetical protein